MLLLIIAITVVLIVSFLCSIFESVLLTVRRTRIEVLRRNGDKAGDLLAGFKANMDSPIAAILILNTSAHTIGASVSGASYSNVFGTATLWLFSLLFTLVVLLFTEIIPKTLGVNYANTLAVPAAWGIHWMTKLLKPLVIVSEKISRSLRRDVAMPITSAEELRLLAFLGGNEGAVARRTAAMVVGATQLRHLHATDVMLPRDEIDVRSATMNREEALTAIRLSGHSRFPLSASSDLDDVNAVVFANEVLAWLLDNDAEIIDWAALSHEPLIVPESSPLPQLLNTFQDSQQHLAVVVDEYGSVQGIAALEDVLEEIVGDIRDEFDLGRGPVFEHTENAIIVSGLFTMRELQAETGWAFEWQPRETVAAWAERHRGQALKRGESFTIGDYRITATDVSAERPRRIKVERLPAETK